ncbi:MAG: FAD-dependent oxidoreductase, partial [Clostridia bacterium]|nr:FAD-dependent oxidoreductase [Clostridia bacterium]
MKTISEQLTTPVGGEFDVIVCGGGPTGVCAAIAAGRAGAKVLLLERMNCLGGMWTSGFVNPLFDQENKGGLIREIVNRLDKKQAWGGFRNISFNYEYMKCILDDMCREAGVKVLFNTTFARTLVEDSTVKGVVCEHIGGRVAYLSKTVIDCTGDAAVAASAGVEFDMGDEKGDCQAMTLMFLLSNIPEKYNNEVGLMMAPVIEEAFAKEGKGKHTPFAFPVLIPNPNSRFANVQMTHMYNANPLCPEDIARALYEGRQQMLEVVEALKAYDPDFKDTDLVFSAPSLGVRESRRIKGEYTVTLHDLIKGATFDDAIAFSAFNIEIHNSDETSQNLLVVPRYEIP